ncbi:hypothetical protein [Nocardia sp. NPDC057227]|uniref:hypothetical protein n=1 Tax=Nocardia sp. NPDC057227 TaxID=3346056 RepID=UPI00363D0B5B
MTDYSPEKVDLAIAACANRIANGVKVCDERYTTYLQADHAYDVAYAHAYLNAEGPAHAKKYEAEIATENERRARDVADAAYRYADRTARAVQDELRALQSVGASIRAMYQVAGRGEGA